MRQLLGDLGKSIDETLNNPPKQSYIVGLKYRFARKKTITANKKKERQMLKNIEKEKGDD